MRHETIHIIPKEHMETKNINTSILVNMSLNLLGDQIARGVHMGTGVGILSGTQNHGGDVCHDFTFRCASWESEEGHCLRSPGRGRPWEGQMDVKGKSADKLEPRSQYWSTCCPFCLQDARFSNVGHLRANHAPSPGDGEAEEGSGWCWSSCSPDHSPPPPHPGSHTSIWLALPHSPSSIRCLHDLLSTSKQCGPH